MEKSENVHCNNIQYVFCIKRFSQIMFFLPYIRYLLFHQTEEDTQELRSAKAAGREDYILAICKLHGFQGKPALENQLQALDAEFHQLKDLRKSGYIQTLFIWKSKKASKVIYSSNSSPYIEGVRVF